MMNGSVPLPSALLLHPRWRSLHPLPWAWHLIPGYHHLHQFHRHHHYHQHRYLDNPTKAHHQSHQLLRMFQPLSIFHSGKPRPPPPPPPLLPSSIFPQLLFPPIPLSRFPHPLPIFLTIFYFCLFSIIHLWAITLFPALYLNEISSLLSRWQSSLVFPFPIKPKLSEISSKATCSFEFFVVVSSSTARRCS